MKKSRFIIPFFFVVLLFLLGCNDDSVTKKAITMDIQVIDTLGTELEVFALSKDNLDADTLLRSAKIVQKTGDSIVLPATVLDLKFLLSTNASWTLDKQKPWGSKASITWMSNPSPSFGGGNSTTFASVKANTATSERRLYIYFATGDSSCVKKYVFLQKGK